MQGQIIRSRPNFILNGEKVTKDFCNLEKHRCIDKSIPFFVNEDDSNIYGQNNILHEAYNFYKNLYSKTETVDYDIKKENIEILKLTYRMKSHSH